MHVFDIKPSNKGPIAFEIASSLGRRRAVRIVAGIFGVRVLRRPRLFTRVREEVFCEFVLNEHLFNIWEPFGRNGRYWIGPSNGKRSSALLQVRQAFIDHDASASRGFTHWMRLRKGTP